MPSGKNQLFLFGLKSPMSKKSLRNAHFFDRKKIRSRRDLECYVSTVQQP